MIKIHQFFLRTTIVITIITLALSASVIVQQLNRNIRGKLDSFLYIPSIGLAVILAFLSIPKLRCNAVAAPHRLIHIAVQVIMGLCGAVLITWTGLVAFNSPLMGLLYGTLSRFGMWRHLCGLRHYWQPPRHLDTSLTIITTCPKSPLGRLV